MQDPKMTDQVAWHETDGPSKSRGVKMQDIEIQDLNCGPENDKPNCRTISCSVSPLSFF